MQAGCASRRGPCPGVEPISDGPSHDEHARRGTPRKRAPVRRKPDPRRRAKEAFEGLEQRHFDLIGLIMVAVGVYAAFVLYLRWDGGRVGSGWRRRSSTRSAGSSTWFR